MLWVLQQQQQGLQQIMQYLQLSLKQDQNILLCTADEVPDSEGGEVVVGIQPMASHDGFGGCHHMVPHILRGTCTV